MRYFAYGSNLNLSNFREWLARWGADPRGIRLVRPAILSGYRLRTNYLRLSGWGAANIEPADNSVVEGILMTLSPAAHEALRAKEGWPHRYVESSVLVQPPGATRRIRAMTYTVSDEYRLPFDLPITEPYRQLILDGAAAADLSSVYQWYLRQALVTLRAWLASSQRKQSA